MADWTVTGQEPLPPSKWQVTGQEPIPMSFGRQLLGNAELGGSAIANIPHALAHAAADIVHRVSGNYDAPDPKWVQHLEVPQGQAGSELAEQLGNSLTNTIDSTGAGNAVTRGVGAINESGNEPGTVANFGKKVVAPIAGDVAALAGLKGPVMGAVGAAKNGLSALSDAAGVGTDWNAAGFRTGGAHPIAREVAGDSGRPALIDHNAQVSNTIASNEAGHAPGVPMSYDSMADARAAPNSVYNRVANTLPEDGQLDATAQAQIKQAGLPQGGRMSDGSPDAAAKAEQLRSDLLDPNKTFNGQQMVNEVRGLRQEGFTNSASDDVSNQQLGKAQLDMARAVEGHIGRNLPQNGPVSLQQFQDARKLLAKNYTVQSALRGGDVDPKVLARVQRNDPELLDGGLKTIADFANGAGKDVVGIPDRYNPPNVFKDVGGIVNVHRPVQSTIQGIPGVGTTARRILTGSTPGAVERAGAMYPGPSPGQFDPLPGLTPPPGRAWRQPQQMSIGDLAQGPGPSPYTLEQGAAPPAATPKPAPASIPLSELLAHGVEQPGAPGLSAGPMGAPAQEGLPFTASPDMVGVRPQPRQVFNPAQRPVQVGDRFAVPPQPERIGDVAAAGLQGRAGGPMTPAGTTEPQLGVGAGVPEDIAARTPQAPPVSHEADEQTGEHTVTSPNGSTHAQESGPFLISKRSDTAASAQGRGEGVARAETLIQQAEARGLRYSSDVSVSPAMQRVYDALKRRGYNVMRNPDAQVNSDTGNLVSNDPRKPVFIVRSRLSQAVGQ